MNVRNRLLLIILVPAILIVSIASYYRFMVSHDYLVTYEGECDPASQACYVGCEDDECTEEYYYSLIEKYAADVYSQCGADITDCADAHECLSTDSACTITYCDIETESEACEFLTAEDFDEGTEVLGEPEEEESAE